MTLVMAMNDDEEHCDDDDNDAGTLVILGRQLELSALRRAGFFQSTAMRKGSFAWQGGLRIQQAMSTSVAIQSVTMDGTTLMQLWSAGLLGSQEQWILQ